MAPQISYSAYTVSELEKKVWQEPHACTSRGGRFLARPHQAPPQASLGCRHQRKKAPCRAFPQFPARNSQQPEQEMTIDWHFHGDDRPLSFVEDRERNQAANDGFIRFFAFAVRRAELVITLENSTALCLIFGSSIFRLL